MFPKCLQHPFTYPRSATGNKVCIVYNRLFLFIIRLAVLVIRELFDLFAGKACLLRRSIVGTLSGHTSVHV